MFQIVERSLTFLFFLGTVRFTSFATEVVVGELSYLVPLMPSELCYRNKAGHNSETYTL